MSGKFLQGAVSRGLREAGAAMRQEGGVMEVRNDLFDDVDGANHRRLAFHEPRIHHKQLLISVRHSLLSRFLTHAFCYLLRCRLYRVTAPR